jgi:GGDEF domain-containing protein
VELYVSASISDLTYPEDGNTAETLLKNADTAMYQTKDCGRNNYQFFWQK